MQTTATKTLTAIIDGWDSVQGIVYGAVADERVGVREYNARPVNPRIVPLTLPLDQSFTKAMDARIVVEGYRRIGDWTKHGPLSYTAPIEAHPQRCETCVNGCECEPGTPGCGHYGCWQASDEIRDSCPGVAAVKPGRLAEPETCGGCGRPITTPNALPEVLRTAGKRQCEACDLLDRL